MDPASIGFRLVTNPAMHVSVANSAKFRKTEIGAGNGHSNARGVARIRSMERSPRERLAT